MTDQRSTRESRAGRSHANGASPSGGRGGLRWPFTRNGSERSEAAARASEEQRARTREVGEHLKRTRIGLSLELAEVERDTRINRAYLEALEAGHFETLPAPVYARGFMRSYARYLGLDPEEAVAAIPRDLPRPAGLEPMAGLRRSASPALSLSGLNLPVVTVASLAALVVLVAVFVVPRLGGGDGIDLPLEGRAPAPAIPAGEATPPVGGAPSAEATVPPFTAGEVPSLAGVHRDEAVRVLEDAGLTPLVFEAPNEAPAGRVFQQSPAAGEPVNPGGVVTIFVSQGPGE